MNEKVEIAVDYFKIFLAWCKANPKILSTLFLILLTFITITVALSTDIPDKILDNNNNYQISDTKFVDFQLNVTQLEWVLKNCGYYACIEDLCYCYIRNELTWEKASETCRNSGFPDAGLMKPLKPKGGGTFETYKNVIGFLNSIDMYMNPLWSGLSRDDESKDFTDESGESYSWFHSYKRAVSTNQDQRKSCVWKITSAGWATNDCSNNELLRLPPEYSHLFMNETFDKHLQWDDGNPNGHATPQVYIKVKILCELELGELSQDETDCIQNNTSGYYIEGPEGVNSVYYMKSHYSVWRQRDRERICSNSDCYHSKDGHRAVINSKEEEKFFLEKMHDIFVEIGLGLSEEVQNGDLVWDNKANGLPTDQLQWYYEGKMKAGPNCIASESFSSSDHQLDWVAKSCRETHKSVCTFKPPKLGKKEIATSVSRSSGTISNRYGGYFCLDETRSTCYLRLEGDFQWAKDFVTEKNFQVAVLKDSNTKKTVAQKIKPYSGVYVGASAMRRGDKFEWMYEEKNNLVQLDSIYEAPQIGQHLANGDKKICLVLASNGSFVASVCDTNRQTLIDVSKDKKYEFMKFNEFVYF